MTISDDIEATWPDADGKSHTRNNDSHMSQVAVEKIAVSTRNEKAVPSLGGLVHLDVDSFTQISTSTSAVDELPRTPSGQLGSFLRATDRTQILREVLARTIRVRANSDHSDGLRINEISGHPSMVVSEECPRTHSQHSFGARELNSWGCAFSVINLILGNAIFTLPYGFVMGGWVSVPVLILAIGIFLWTSVLLGYTLQELQSRGVSEPDYGVVGEYAFGEKFRPIFTSLCGGECFFMCIFLLVFIADSLMAILGLSKELIISVAAGCGVLLSLVPKRFMAIVSVLGLVLTLTCAAAVVAWGFNTGPRPNSNSLYGTQGVIGLVYMASFAGICVADHPVFPGLYNSARKPDDFFNGLIYGFAFFALSALVVSSCTYFTFGSNVQPVVLLNMGHDTHMKPIGRFEWMETVANMVIAFRTLLVLPSFIRPVVGIIEDVGLRAFGFDWDLHVQRRRGYRFSLIFVAFSVCTIAAVILQDYLPEIEALTGSLFKSVNALIIPCWSYYRLCKPTFTITRLAIHVVILGAFVWGFYGTYSAVTSIMADSSYP